MSLPDDHVSILFDHLAAASNADCAQAGGDLHPTILETLGDLKTSVDTQGREMLEMTVHRILACTHTLLDPGLLFQIASCQHDGNYHDILT